MKLWYTICFKNFYNHKTTKHKNTMCISYRMNCNLKSGDQILQRLIYHCILCYNSIFTAKVCEVEVFHLNHPLNWWYRVFYQKFQNFWKSTQMICSSLSHLWQKLCLYVTKSSEKSITQININMATAANSVTANIHKNCKWFIKVSVITIKRQMNYKYINIFPHNRKIGVWNCFSQTHVKNTIWTV